MSKFCSNCGKEVTGNFCSNCGTRLEDDMICNINGVTIDYKELVDLYGKDKVNAIKYVSHAANLKLNEAKKIVDEAYKKVGNKSIIQTGKEAYHEEMKNDLAKRNLKKKYEEEGTPYCPKCMSTNIHAEKRGWKLTTGLLGSSKIMITCLNCGHKWRAGKK